MTRRVALIGKPLRRPHSAVMHNAAFAAHEIDARFELLELEPGEVPGFFREAHQDEWLGFGVTAPYKQEALRHIDEVEPGAVAIGAVNNGVRTEDGRLIGFNTDASGFIRAVESTGTDVSGRETVVVGAGGAARAVVWALLDAGASRVFVANRTADRAKKLAQDMSAYGLVEAGSPGSASCLKAMESAAIAVNATTVGMDGETIAFDVDPLDPGCLVFDLVYVPADTPLVGAAVRRGLNSCNGLEMLVYQGEIAFERWTGVSDTADVMRSALASWKRDQGN